MATGLSLPDNLSIIVTENNGVKYTHLPGTYLSGWNQDFIGSDHIHNSGDAEVVRILVETGSDFVAYLFKDKISKYREHNSKKPFAELKYHFYDNLPASLRKKFKVKRKDVSMIIVPRYVENFGMLDIASIHSHDTAQTVNPLMCEVVYAQAKSRSRSRSRSTDSSSSSKNSTRRKTPVTKATTAKATIAKDTIAKATIAKDTTAKATTAKASGRSTRSKKP